MDIQVSARPRDDKGHYVPLTCPVCDAGTLRHQGGHDWACDGLLDPNDPNKELEACWFTHTDGQPYHETAGA